MTISFIPNLLHKNTFRDPFYRLSRNDSILSECLLIADINILLSEHL